MKTEDCFYFGKIGKPKGFKGEVNIIIDKSAPISPSSLNEVLILIGKKLINYPLKSYKLSPKGNAIAQFEDINSESDVNRIKNLPIYLPKRILPELGDSDYYLHDLVDCTVTDLKYGEIGIVREVSTQTSQIILFIETKKDEIVVPFVNDFIINVNTSNKEINLNLPEGIISLNE
ncbi:MAG: 16S rRNA processing protein RimM [Flavobacteriales bacterium]|nr:16S rRNA processing protein RimM [Flavobacteriales bacterium]|tara:strand:+ start:2049 stop:2573 length:525 start_codon:yes stop_codon:yes gene_type:complete